MKRFITFSVIAAISGSTVTPARVFASGSSAQGRVTMNIVSPTSISFSANQGTSANVGGRRIAFNVHRSAGTGTMARSTVASFE